MKNIREFVKNRKKVGAGNLDCIGGETPKWKRFITISPVSGFKRACTASRWGEERPTRVSLTPGVGEIKYQKINDLCFETRKNVQVMIKRFKNKRNSLRNAVKGCEEAVKAANESQKSLGLSEEFVRFRNNRRRKKVIKNNSFLYFIIKDWIIG